MGNKKQYRCTRNPLALSLARISQNLFFQYFLILCEVPDLRPALAKNRTRIGVATTDLVQRGVVDNGSLSPTDIVRLVVKSANEQVQAEFDSAGLCLKT